MSPAEKPCVRLRRLVLLQTPEDADRSLNQPGNILSERNDGLGFTEHAVDARIHDAQLNAFGKLFAFGGSSRMKSGTGQKMILNMITTSVMIQLGRVKGNKMVNMQLSNQKLIDRGTRMIVEELGLYYDQAKALLLMHGSVKKAVDAYKSGTTKLP